MYIVQKQDPPLESFSPFVHFTFLAFTHALYKSWQWLIETIKPPVIHGLFCIVRLEHLGTSSLHVVAKTVN